MPRKNKRRETRNTAEEELNLIPVMNLFVCLIPFLLLTATFAQFGSLRAELPKGASSQDIQNQKESKGISIIFELNKEAVKIRAFTNSFQTELTELADEFSVDQPEALLTHINRILEKHPKLESSLFKASGSSKYQKVIEAMSLVQNHPKMTELTLATTGVLND